MALQNNSFWLFQVYQALLQKYIQKFILFAISSTVETSYFYSTRFWKTQILEFNLQF